MKEEERQALFSRVEQLYQLAPNWIWFFRRVFGTDGILRRELLSQDRAIFLQSEHGSQSYELLTDLRSGFTTRNNLYGPERMITIRLPTCLHQSLQLESTENDLSMNQLVISKLLVPLSKRFMPVFVGRRRGRRFGPQKKTSTGNRLRHVGARRETP